MTLVRIPITARAVLVHRRYVIQFGKDIVEITHFILSLPAARLSSAGNERFVLPIDGPDLRMGTVESRLAHRGTRANLLPPYRLVLEQFGQGGEQPVEIAFIVVGLERGA